MQIGICYAPHMVKYINKSTKVGIHAYSCKFRIFHLHHITSVKTLVTFLASKIFFRKQISESGKKLEKPLIGTAKVFAQL